MFNVYIYCLIWSVYSFHHNVQTSLPAVGNPNGQGKLAKSNRNIF